MAAKNTPKYNKKEQNTESFFKGVRAEFKKIVWSTPKEVVNFSLVVLIISAITALLVYGLDTLFQYLVGIFV